MYTWLVADGSIPPDRGAEMPPHEAICFVNPTTQDAIVHLDIYYVTKEPTKGLSFTVPAERSAHIPIGADFGPGGKFGKLAPFSLGIPANTPFSLRARSDVKMGCQYTRVLTTKDDFAIMTTYIPAESD
jgi:hypothetical protein